MPPWLFWAHVRMRPQLEAEEALARISQTAAGSGAMEERDQRNYRRDLARAASGGRQPRAVKASVASLRQIGIRVETAPETTAGAQLPEPHAVEERPELPAPEELPDPAGPSSKADLIAEESDRELAEIDREMDALINQ